MKIKVRSGQSRTRSRTRPARSSRHQETKPEKPETPELKGWAIALIFALSVVGLFIQQPISEYLEWAWFLKPFWIVLRFALFCAAVVSGVALIRLQAAWIPLSVLLFWALGVSVEGYYHAFGGSLPPFVPKPWEQAETALWLDLGKPSILGPVWQDATYLLSLTICLAVQLAQSWIGVRSSTAHLPREEKLALRVIAGFSYALDLYCAIRSAPALTDNPLSIVGWALQFLVMIFAFEVLFIGLFGGFRSVGNYFQFLGGKDERSAKATA